jgi:hypothetical protein
MGIKQQGGIFGRNPTFNNVTVDGILTVDQIVEKTGAAGITLDGVTLKDGNVVLADGKGIDFSATAGTGTSELFDDYEEGTWTPTIEGSTTAGTQTYNAQVAKYTKVGRTVTICAFVSITNKDAAMAGNVRIGGLPYASDGTANALHALALGDFQGVTFGASKTQLLLRVPNNVTKINAYDGGSGLASAQIPISNINNATYFVVGGTYQTA